MTPHAHDQIIVLANRQPFRHDYDASGRIVVRHAAAGVVHAVEPLLTATSGVWVGHGAGSADRAVVDRRDGVAVPPGNPSYRLRRVWLSEAEERGYYDGFANGGLWPLCHRAFVKPVFRSGDFAAYSAVNARFAGAVAEEAAADAPLVLVQDYHFALAPRMIRALVPGAVVATFWHIPWPHGDDLAMCPWRDELLDGLLGSDLIGFQTPQDAANFLETVDGLLAVDVDRNARLVAHRGRSIWIRDYPASIEWPAHCGDRVPAADECRAAVQRAMRLPPDVKLGVGVDRMDYTKGLEEKVVAIEHLLERDPTLRHSFAFVQLAQPTRVRLAAYREFHARLEAAVNRVNRRFEGPVWPAITLLERDHTPEDVFRWLRAADFCYVGSLHDGMNLVSKEFVSARSDERGVLVLSRFAGAASELRDALIVNPFDMEETAGAMARALAMDPHEQRRRMRAMRTAVALGSARHWAELILADATRIRNRRDTTAAPGRDSHEICVAGR